MAQHKKPVDPVTADAAPLGDGNDFDQSAVDEVMKKYDRESNTRIWEGWQKWVVYGVMAAFSLFVLYVTLFATWLDLVRYPSFMAGILLCGYLMYPIKKGVQKVNHIAWYDWIIMLASLGSFLYIALNAQDLTVRAVGYKSLYTYEVILGIFGILALIELCRRAVGIPILCVAGFFLLYALYYFCFVKDLGFVSAVTQMVYRLMYTTTGILTTPVQVCAKFIIVFIVFGAFLERTGIANFFIDIANCLFGSAAGGPAKVAVVSSALCGMVSGSSVGNTVTTGSVTIPMMKRTGYKAEFAGAVEAAASTGGQIMPPIMGAAAFLMAEYVGVPYSNIIVRAILPAFLYFLGIFIGVHLEAKKMGLKGLSREQLPVFKKLVKHTYLLLPLIILVYLVSSGSRTMAFSAAIAIIFAVSAANFAKNPAVSAVGCVALLVYLFVPLTGWAATLMLIVGVVSTLLSMIKPSAIRSGDDTQNVTMTPAVFFDALANGGKGSISVGVACGIAGVIAGCITMTGLASQIISAVIAISGGHLFIAMLLTMICCIILGMGVPTTANYCIMASTCAPILIQLGMPTMAAHFFVFYFGIVADITPPVALAAFAGAAIAKANPMKTGFNATKLAIAAFIIPFIFGFNPAMLLIDTSVLEVAQIVITSTIGMIGVAAALEGYIHGQLHWALRILIAAGGLLLIDPGLTTDIVGIVIVGAVFGWQLLQKKKAAIA